MEDGLQDTPGLTLIERVKKEHFVASSFQFLLADWDIDPIREVLSRCAKRGVELKWFGADEPAAFTSKYSSWKYANPTPMPKTDAILHGVVDMRLPLTFSLDDYAQIARIIRAEVSAVWQANAA